MKPPEEVVKDLTRQCLAKAEQDYGLAEHLLAEEAPYFEAVGFNCQQASEKYLKAFLHVAPSPVSKDAQSWRGS